MDFKSEHNLEFEVAPFEYNLEPKFTWQRFRIGTCNGLWRPFDNCYEILAVVNDITGNGHLNDVFQWFENSCKRDNYNLKVLEFFNDKFRKHLIKNRGFIELNKNDIIKYSKDMKKVVAKGMPFFCAEAFWRIITPEQFCIWEGKTLTYFRLVG